jgi:hypothetical protein
MPYEQRPSTGSLFSNRGRKNGKAPNFKGSGLLELDGGRLVELDLAGWTRESERAGKWLSLSIKLKADRPIRQRFDGIGRRQGLTEFVNEHGTPVDESLPQATEEDDVPFRRRGTIP